MITARTLVEASGARCLACISFHYVQSRFNYLFETLRTLSDYLVAQVDIVIITNTDEADIAPLEDLCGQLSGGAVHVSIRCAGVLEHPWDLTWEHKDVLRGMVAEHSDAHTHFIYLEDDLRLPFVAFCYFLANRPILAQFGLIPSFLRIEFNNITGAITASDLFGPETLSGRPKVAIGQTSFISMANPYCGLYVFDRSLAEEHVASRSFDRIASEGVCGWGVRERAAMGQCFENPPPGFLTRYVVPVDVERLALERMALVHHLPNNYSMYTTPGPNYLLGKTRLDAVIAGGLRNQQQT